MRIYKTKSYYVVDGDFHITLSGRSLLENKYGLLDAISNGTVTKLVENGIVLIDKGEKQL